jgi:S1-C subfamily serine protease
MMERLRADESERQAHRLALGISVACLITLALVAVYLLRPGGPVEEAREGDVGASPAPDPALLTSPSVARARQSVLRVVGTANGCARQIEGTGFVYSNERVLTAAHVVAGVESPDVETPADGVKHPADVVLFDPDRDIAVLRVPGLTAGALRFASTAHGGERAVVAGYPGHEGRLTLLAAWIRNRKPAIGPDIYDIGRVQRMIYTVGAAAGNGGQGLVQPGDSGGPLLASDGSVFGMTFAAEQKNPDLGYALPVSELADAARTGRTAIQPVSTRSCTP